MQESTVDIQDEADQVVARQLVGELDAMIAELAVLRATYARKLVAYRKAARESVEAERAFAQ